MIEVPLQQGHRLAPFFSFTEETPVRSFTQGHMGRGWLDQEQAPACAKIITGDFCFLAGDAHAPGAGELAGHIAEEYAGRDLLVICENEQWEHTVRRVFPGCTETLRYAMKKDTRFDKKKLQSLVDALHGDFSLRPIDKALYHQCLEQPFAQDLCSQFASADDYARRGIGVGVLRGDELVGGASSYTIYDQGIEIEIDVKEEYRRRGLATACAAALILRCLDRGLYPSWDAANKPSAALAQKLGYEFAFAYKTFAVRG